VNLFRNLATAVVGFLALVGALVIFLFATCLVLSTGIR